MVRHLAAALGHMHGLGWSHHDLKPGNVLVFKLRQPDGSMRTVYKLGDLGLAGALEQTRAQATR
jgi:serine/threonine protein kinase